MKSLTLTLSRMVFATIAMISMAQSGFAADAAATAAPECKPVEAESLRAKKCLKLATKEDGWHDRGTYAECIIDETNKMDKEIAAAIDRMKKLIKLPEKFGMPDLAISTIVDSQQAFEKLRKAQCDILDSLYMTNGIPNLVNCRFDMTEDRLELIDGIKSDVEDWVK